MFTHKDFDVYEYKDIPLNRDLFMMDESFMEEYEKNLLKRSNLDPCCFS